MRRVCTILARGGSKGLPGKNLRPLAGKSLVARTVAQAREANLFDVVVASSDDPDILAEARAWGVDLAVERPADMATDAASKLPPIQHAVLAAERQLGAPCDIIVDLDVTSPLRIVDDIRGAVRLQEETGATSVITGAPARKSPYFNLVETDAQGRVRLCKPTVPRIARRQEAPPCYDMNAAVYVWQRAMFMSRPDVFYDDTRIYVMPEERSHDIDTPLDFTFVSLILTQNGAGNH